MSTTHARIKTGHSRSSDATTAVAELAEQLRQAQPALVMFFCSTAYDLDVLAQEINRQFAGIAVVGCTTAGEIGPAGYLDHSLSGMSFPSGACTTVCGSLDRLNDFEIAHGQAFARDLLHELVATGAEVNMNSAFGILLIDGVSLREEPVAHAFQSGLGIVPMVGGSAGDDLRFERTWVFHDGRFQSDSAVLVLISTIFPFRTLRTQHFLTAEERVVVTEVDAARRVVKEINGFPAVDEYARLVQVAPQELAPSHFATWPVVVMIDGTDYVRSIQKANPDGSLTFYCAIDEGLVLRVAHGHDMVGKLRETFDQLRQELGELQTVFVCDCILRNLEAQRSGIKAQLAEVLAANNAVGMSTYGEQYTGVHVNQTLTGIAFGHPDIAGDA